MDTGSIKTERLCVWNAETSYNEHAWRKRLNQMMSDLALESKVHGEPWEIAVLLGHIAIAWWQLQRLTQIILEQLQFGVQDNARNIVPGQAHLLVRIWDCIQTKQMFRVYGRVWHARRARRLHTYSFLYGSDTLEYPSGICVCKSGLIEWIGSAIEAFVFVVNVTHSKTATRLHSNYVYLQLKLHLTCDDCVHSCCIAHRFVLVQRHRRKLVR